MTFIKANLWKLLSGIVVIFLLITGYNVLRDFLFNAGLAAARADYDLAIAESNAKLNQKNQEYINLIGDAERKRQEVKAQHEAEIRKFKNDIGYFKSETAEALKAKSATVEQWAAEKVKDEVTINLQTERIGELDLQLEKMRLDWLASDIAINKSYRAIIDELTFKFTRCQEWSDKLEAKAKRKPFAKVLQVAVIGAAFALGRISAK